MRTGNEIQLADYEVAEGQEINLRDYWDRIWRRRSTVLAVTLGVFVLGAFWTFIQRPVYTAKSQLLIEKEPNILSFDQVLQIEAMRDDFYQTQYKLLSGRGLADTVMNCGGYAPAFPLLGLDQRARQFAKLPLMLH